jgi:SAM-dependent methyltransferase
MAGVLAIWAVAGAAVVHTAVGINRPLELPTARFLESGGGRVLDAGAGSGRSSLMVLLARPGARVTALDVFSADYGIGDNSPGRLRANARAAGVEPRLEVQVGDMRNMPFTDASFDAAVSAFAIDHLRQEGVQRTFAEMGRVIRPGGEFLLMVINPDAWVRVAFPFFVHHGYFGGRADPDRWREQLSAAGFEVVEQGTAPATLYFLARNAR